MSKIIIFVCVSNTCRSPMAEYLCRDILSRYGLDTEYTVVSRSLSTDYEPECSPASLQGIQVMMEDYRINMESHRSKLLNDKDVENAFMIVPVKRDLGVHISNEFKGANAKVVNLAENISDPWHQPVNVFRGCAKQIYFLLSELLERTKVINKSLK